MPTVIKDCAELFTRRADVADNARVISQASSDGPSAEALAGLLEIMEQLPPGATVSASAIAALLACALGEL